MEDIYESTELHKAAEYGDVELAKVWLETATDVDVKRKDGATPLHRAAACGQGEVLKLLLQHGADVEAKDANAWTPLHFAVYNRHKAAASLLVLHGSDTRAKPQGGFSPFELAASIGEEMLQALEAETITQRLDRLFERWKAEVGKPDDFAEDGVIDEDKWLSAPRRVLFLLKETNEFRDDLRVLVREKPWNVLGYWAYGLQHAKANYVPPFRDAIEHYKYACRSSAVVNLKKTTGKGSTTEEAVFDEAGQYFNLTWEELQIIRPDIVVCGGTFEMARRLFPGIRSASAADPEERCHRDELALWIDYCHPSIRAIRHDILYYGLVGMFSVHQRR